MMKPSSVFQLTVQELAERIALGQPTFLVDVRQPWEHEIAALPGSRLVALDRLATEAGQLEIPQDALVVVYCHHGIRSLTGAALLQRLGIPRVASLAGGIDAWSLQVDPGVPRY
jgi:rhodanese-related sulfurtransferase